MILDKDSLALRWNKQKLPLTCLDAEVEKLISGQMNQSIKSGLLFALIKFI